MELADLTKGMRQIKLLEPDFSFAKPGLSEFHKSSAEKAIFQVAKNSLFYAVPGLTREQQQQEE